MRHFGNTYAVDLCNPDFIQFAQSFGVQAYRAKSFSDFEAILRRALTLKGPVFIEVISEPSLKSRLFKSTVNTIKKIKSKFK